jgi:hypothetical protein
MAGPWERAGRTRRQRIAQSYSRFVEPRPSGLPNWRVVTWFPGLVGFLASMFIALGISGTSSGAHWSRFGVGADPQLLLGAPRPIRSDEWLVSQSWIVSQYQQGFPSENATLPGGMDATVLMELPNWDWSTLFRPHEWGFLLFGLDIGTAWQWWLPALALVSGAYLLVVTLAPRRSVAAAIVATALFFSPMFQWWFGSNALWPAAWSLLAMAGVIWMLRDDRIWIRITWAVVLGWLAVTMAIGLYVPFLLPSVLVFIFFFIGIVLEQRPWRHGTLTVVARRLAPLVAAGVFAGSVVVAWFLSRQETFEAIQSTVYPGERSDPAGQLLREDPNLTGIGGAPFGQSFLTGSTILGPNPSEAATSILLALFLAPALVWFVVRRYRRDHRLDWMMIGALASLALILAFLLIPGWDAVAQLLLLDKVPVSRYRMAFSVMIPLFFALIVREVDRRPNDRNGLVSAVCTLASLALFGFTLSRVITLDPATLESSLLWPVTTLGITAAVALIFFRRTISIAALALLLASLSIGAAVNPFYQGVFNLNDTRIGEAVIDLNASERGSWVGVGTYEAMALMMTTGVRAYSGVQTYPPEEMWSAIDPSAQYEEVWNRLAHVRWTWGTGEPAPQAPYRDLIQLEFNACSDFAQKHVDFVLADEVPLTMDCLSELDVVTQGETTMRIFRVVPE